MDAIFNDTNSDDLQSKLENRTVVDFHVCFYAKKVYKGIDTEK
jgi:hypothetical protein